MPEDKGACCAVVFNVFPCAAARHLRMDNDITYFLRLCVGEIKLFQRDPPFRKIFKQLAAPVAASIQSLTAYRFGSICVHFYVIIVSEQPGEVSKLLRLSPMKDQLR